jgi:hypothetical protein
MKILLATMLTVILLASVGCGGDDKAGDTPQENPPAAGDAVITSNPGTPPNGDAAKPEAELDVNVGTLIGKVKGEDWRLVEKLTEQFYEGKLDALYKQFSPGFKEVWSRDRLKDFRDQTLTQFGTEIELVGTDREATTTQDNVVYRAYSRAVRFSDHEGLVEVSWLLNEQQQVSGLFVTPAKNSDK